MSLLLTSLIDFLIKFNSLNLQNKMNAHHYSMITMPYGLQQCNAGWIPRTPREPFVAEFRPNPKDTWMVDLRLSSHRECGLEVHEDEQPHALQKKKYYMAKNKPSQKKQE